MVPASTKELKETVIDIPDSWLDSVYRKLQKVEEQAAPVSPNVLMHRIPRNLREGDHKDFVPEVVSLGPYYYGGECYKEMDNHKWRSFYQALKRNKLSVELYFNTIKALEEEARSCYEGPIDLNSNAFVEMLVLDGCFILELFQGVDAGFKQLGYPSDDPVFRMHGYIHPIQRDMIMLENQLPLFILDSLLNLQEVGQNLLALIIQFFQPLAPTSEHVSHATSKLNVREMNKRTVSGLSCLYVFHRYLIGKETKMHLEPRKWKRKSSPYAMGDKKQQRQRLIQCVTELKESGIKFKKGGTENFWNIKYKNGTLQIPRLSIHGGTKSLLVNLIAFEQCHPCRSNEVTSYVIFMDNLINSSKDVAHFQDTGIIEHLLSSDAEVVDLFKQLSKVMVFDINESYLSELTDKVKEALQSVNWNRLHWNRLYTNWNLSLTILRANYFNNRWAFISFLGAVSLLFLAFTQTFYAVYAYYRPRS